MQLQCKYPDSAHILHTQVLHNMALNEAHMGHWDKAQVHLVSALDYKTEAKLSLIDRALQSTLVSRKHCRGPPPSSPQMFCRSDTTLHRYHLLSCWPFPYGYGHSFPNRSKTSSSPLWFPPKRCSDRTRILWLSWRRGTIWANRRYPSLGRMLMYGRI